MTSHTAFTIHHPPEQTVPFVLSSPHSGRYYPPAFIAASSLDSVKLRLTEDAYVDELYQFAPNYGAPLLAATVARSYCDVNREAYELDPLLICDPLPGYANSKSPRVRGGYGTVARVVADGTPIYRQRLSLQEALHRINTWYFPYHQALTNLIEETRHRFGFAILLDCHSMPAIGGPMDADPGSTRPDIVLGSNHGKSCPRYLLHCLRDLFISEGYQVALESPYAGGYITQYYGNLDHQVMAIQIELCRSLYLDGSPYHKHPKNFNHLQATLEKIVAKFISLVSMQNSLAAE